MNNKEIIDYINQDLKTKFEDIQLEDSKYANEPNNNFYSKFRYKDYTIIFVKDRSFLEIEIFFEGKYSMLHDLNCCFRDIRVTKENIDKANSFLYKVIVE